MAGGEVPGDNREGVDDAALGDGNTGERRDGNRGGDAGDDLAGKACVRERLQLLEAAAEDIRIAALETHDALAGASVLDEQLVDLLLRDGFPIGELGNIDDLFIGGIEEILELCGRPEVIGEDDLCLLERAQATDGDEVPRARAAAYQNHRMCHRRSV